MYQRKNQIQELYLCAVDALCTILSYFLAGFVRYRNLQVLLHANNLSVIIPILLLVHVAAFYALKLQEGFYKRGPLYELKKVTEYAVVMFMGITVFSFSLKNTVDFSRLMIGYFVIINALLIWCVHQIEKGLLKRSYQNKKKASKVLLITTPAWVKQVLCDLQEERSWHFEITGIVLLDCEVSLAEHMEFDGIPVVGNAKNYIEFAKLNVIDEAFIYTPEMKENETMLKNMILDLENMGIVVQLNINIPDLGVKDSKRVYRLGKYYVIAFSSRFFDYRLVILKRLIDIIGAIVGLIITVIIGIVIAPFVLVESPGPLIFSQNRVGKNGRVFKFYKFRSMYRDAEERKKELLAQNEMDGGMFKMENDPRVTKVGRFLRKTSIDELPQFWNVLKGDMSLVGTRPPTVDEYEKYESYQKRRISFKPGITGLWQISGRSNIKSFEEVVQLDLEYIDNWTIWLDIKILCKTIVAVFRGIGAR